MRGLMKIFLIETIIKWDSVGPIKLVTHHWGANWNKGFDFYLILDELIGKAEWKNKIEFTYIGNIPQKANFKNSSIIKPLSGASLADEIKKIIFILPGLLMNLQEIIISKRHSVDYLCFILIVEEFLSTAITMELCLTIKKILKKNY